MNLKRTLISTVVALGLATSVMSPVALADTTEQGTTSEATVNEGGEFTFSLWGPAVTFTPATVTTSQSQTAPLGGANHRVFQPNDTHSYNETGWQLQMEASDLTIAETSYFIDKTNLSVRNGGGGPHSSCLWSGAPAPVGGNDYQDITFDLGSTFTPLSSPVNIVSGSEGRGCGLFQINLVWELFVPAGTYTGGGTAVYSGDITISNVLGVGD
jgi:hypothetical protein